MFRTRDLLLLLLTVGFLLIAILFAATDNKSGKISGPLPQNSPEISAVSAEVPESDEVTLSRAERLEQLKEKIAKSELVTISNGEDEDVPPESTSTTSVLATINELQTCTNYNPFTQPYWPLSDIQQQEMEGVRQYFVTVATNIGTSSSTTADKQVLLTLPQSFIPTGNSSCLSSSVVGVALDGSLIRNNETSLYSVFTSETLIGYALDGFPLYGTGAKPTDTCGGRIEMGQYRYEISTERPNIINCYRGVPQTFTQ